MRSLDNIKAGKGRLCLPCIFVSGRKATIRMNLNEPSKVHLSIESEAGRPYQMGLDNYLHIDFNQLESSSCYQSVEDAKKAISLINTYYFAGKLSVYSDDKEIEYKSVDKVRSIKEWFCDVAVAFTDKGNEFFRELTGEKLTFFDRISNAFQAGKKQKERIEVVQPITSLHLGGTWQKFSEEGWINDAQALSESTIYFA